MISLKSCRAASSPTPLRSTMRSECSASICTLYGSGKPKQAGDNREGNERGSAFQRSRRGGETRQDVRRASNAHTNAHDSPLPKRSTSFHRSAGGAADWRYLRPHAYERPSVLVSRDGGYLEVLLIEILGIIKTYAQESVQAQPNMSATSTVNKKDVVIGVVRG